MTADDLLISLINQHFYRDDTFMLSDAYKLFESAFKKRYPFNSHIRPKIRQQLQVLRDRHFIEFIDNDGYYRVIGRSARTRPPEKLTRATYMPAEEVEKDDLIEGARTTISVNTFERNQKARDACIAHYGHRCSICNFDFEVAYGAYGAGYIQVHHIVPISTVTKQYIVDPIKDLIPVCANCHAIIHRQWPAYTVEEVKNQIAQQNNQGDA